MKTQYIVAWCSHCTNDADRLLISHDVGSLTERDGGGRKARTRVFQSKEEALAAARADRAEFISDERELNGPDSEVETFDGGSWVSAKSDGTIVTWAVLSV